MDTIVTKGDFIRARRIEKKLSAADVCKNMKICVGTLYAIESGSRGIVPKIVDDLISALGLDKVYRSFILYPEGILERDSMSKGELLKLKRLNTRMNVTSLSEKTKVSVSLISCIENGTRSVTRRLYEKLTPKLGITHVSYDVFDSCRVSVKLLYKIDEEYNIPVFGEVYLDDGSSRVREEIKRKIDDGWNVKEYSLLDQTYKEKEILKVM